MKTCTKNGQDSASVRIGIYARYSTDLQRPTSIEDQIRECKDAAERNGWVVADEGIFSDAAVSGQLLAGRDGLEALIEKAEEPNCPFQGIVLDDTSRLGRNLSDTLHLSDRLEYANVFLYFVNRRLDSRDPNFRMLFIFCGQQDEQFSIGLGEKVRRGMKGRVLNGFTVTGHVYGYTNVPIESATRKESHGRRFVDAVDLQKNPEEEAVVIRIFEMYVAGNGYHVISKTLNKEGIPSPLQGRSRKRRMWNTGNVRGILKNEKYRGVNIWSRTKIVRNPTKQRKEQHPRPESEWVRVEVPRWRIVSEETWTAVEKEMQSRQGRNGRKVGGLNRSESSRQSLFSGTMACSACGGPITIVGCQKGIVRFGCIGYCRNGSCENKRTIRRETLESQLLQALSDTLQDPLVRAQVCEKYHELRAAACAERILSSQQVASSVEHLQGKKIELRRNADNLLDTIQSAGKNPLLIDRLNSLNSELCEIEQLLAKLMEVAVEPPSDDAFQQLLGRKLADFQAYLAAGAEVAKQTIRQHIAKLVMTPVETAEGPKYLATGDIRVFARNDPDGVLLDASLNRTIKQYTSVTIQFKATLDALRRRSSLREFYEPVRQAVLVEGRSHRSVALEFGLHLNTVGRLVRLRTPPP